MTSWLFHLKQFFALARLTALEAIRQPIAFLLAATTLALIAFLPLVLSHTLGESAKFVRDGSLSFFFVAGLILGAQTACATLANEIRQGTVSAVLSKPVPRPLFFLAKYAGVAFVMILFCMACTLSVLLSTRTASEPYIANWWAAGPLLLALGLSFLVGGLLNFILRRPFASSAFITLLILIPVAFLLSAYLDPARQTESLAQMFELRILPVSFLITLAILILAAFSVTLATRWTTVPTLSVCTALFLVGLMSDYLFGRHAESNLMAYGLHTLLPNWQHFWVVDALSGEHPIPMQYLQQASAYALFYLAGLLCFVMVAFQRVEMKN